MITSYSSTDKAVPSITAQPSDSSSHAHVIEGVEGDFELHNAVIESIPKVIKGAVAQRWGTSAWARTAKVTVLLDDGSREIYFLKSQTEGKAKLSKWGEYQSSLDITALVPGFVPRPVSKGEYIDESGIYNAFYLMEYHDIDTSIPPDPRELASQVAEMHRNGISPNGMFGYSVPTGDGAGVHVHHWHKTWAAAFTDLVLNIFECDRKMNGPWPQLDAAFQQVVDHVIPRLLGILESDGRSITPSLVHNDLWEGNVGTDVETGKVLAFDPGCFYGHNEVEFGTWRCQWATHFTSTSYIKAYWQEIEPSDPVEEWDDRNRLYSIRAALCDSAGHAGSKSRAYTYNDMLFLCEKYAPLESLEKYDPGKDISVAGNIRESYDVMAGARM